MGLDSANFFRLYKNPRSMPAIPDLPCGKTGHYMFSYFRGWPLRQLYLCGYILSAHLRFYTPRRHFCANLACGISTRSYCAWSRAPLRLAFLSAVRWGAISVCAEPDSCAVLRYALSCAAQVSAWRSEAPWCRVRLMRWGFPCALRYDISGASCAAITTAHRRR